ncbi:MAG: aryl-sulfate sulfotransferase [Verrucomicrobiota bacterium]
MKIHLCTLSAILLCALLPHSARATQADDTSITITGHTAGVTPFISQVTLSASDTSVIKSIQFTITPKAGSVTRALSGTYSNSYLAERGDLQSGTGDIFLPVYGLYAGFDNTVTLTYFFNDGSSKSDSTMISTSTFNHPCGLGDPTVLQARTDAKTLSYDFFLVKGGCGGGFEPAILDTDGALRWVSPAGFSVLPSAFFENAVFQSSDTSLFRVDLDGTITSLHDYSDIGVTFLHHNIDPGKFGLIIDVDTTEQIESVNLEVDATGKVLKRWDLAEIISAAMIAGGDDPSEFVFPAPTDWFHNNTVTYNRADDSVLISSRESFVICLDYETDVIKWILGDPTKKWHQFPSLAKFELDVPAPGVPPIGEHSLSISYDQNLLLFDNGFASIFQMPQGLQRGFASPRKYTLDLAANTATEVFSLEMNQSILDPICSSIYEDAPLNYLVDYAFVGGFAAPDPVAEILGLDSAGEQIFRYQYPTNFCDTAYNSTPLHLESTKFPAVRARPLNLSTRGVVGSGDNSLIGGFIVTGTESQTVVLRALGPSLADSGLSALADPVLTLFNSAGRMIARNDDWENAANADKIAANGLAPSDPAESATYKDLVPGTYTFVVTGKDSSPGIGLVEAYDLSPLADARLANLSTRGSVGTGDGVLISGFIVGDVDSETLVLRALGPSLGSAGLSDPLSDPMLSVFDNNGVLIASNDNWQEDISAADIEKNGLAPSDDAESATILHLPAGTYTTIVSGAAEDTGVGLVEIYGLN